MSIEEKLTTIAENQQRVYNAGYESGYSDGGSGGSYDLGWSEGYTQGYAEGEENGWGSGYSIGLDEGNEEGKQAQENAFWDTYQQNGTRTDYQGAFGGLGWTNEMFKPKYNMQPTSAYYMFRRSGISGDLVEILENLGVTLDFSECTSALELFSNTYNLTRVGVLDFSKISGSAIGNCFAWSGVKTIDKVIVTPNTRLDNFPGAAQQLESITFEGTIAKPGLDMTYCTKLSKASIISIINALSTTTSGLSITLSKTAVTNAFGSTTASEWTTLVGTKSNWTINLV